MKTLWFFLSFLLLFLRVQGGVLSELGAKYKRQQPRPYHDQTILPPNIFDAFSDATEVYRADWKNLETVQTKGGFPPRPNAEDPRKYSVWSHTQGLITNTAYVSTTDALGDVVAFYAENIKSHPENVEKKAYIYKIENSKNFIDVNKSLRLMDILTNKEHAAMGGIPISQVKEYTEATPEVILKLREGKRQEIKWTVNKDYRPLPAEMRGSSTLSELAGWPADHPAWTEDPWKKQLQTKTGGPDVSSRFKKKMGVLSKQIPGLLEGLEKQGLAEAFIGANEDLTDETGYDSDSKNRLKSGSARKRLRKPSKSPEKSGPGVDETGSEDTDAPPEDDGDESAADNKSLSMAERFRRLRQKVKPKAKPSKPAGKPGIDDETGFEDSDGFPDNNGDESATDIKGLSMAERLRRLRQKAKPKDNPSKPAGKPSIDDDTGFEDTDGLPEDDGDESATRKKGESMADRVRRLRHKAKPKELPKELPRPGTDETDPPTDVESSEEDNRRAGRAGNWLKKLNVFKTKKPEKHRPETTFSSGGGHGSEKPKKLPSPKSKGMRFGRGGRKE